MGPAPAEWCCPHRSAGLPAAGSRGNVAAFGFYANAQAARPNAGQSVKPLLRINFTVVGKAVFSSEGAQDDDDTSGRPAD
jgi:hypothetical protein